MSLRAGLVGCGRIGAGINAPGIGASRLGSHAEALAASARFTFEAACDPDPARREDMARRYPGVRLFATAGEMLRDASLDVVAIATGPRERLTLVEQAAHAGVRGLFIEKPLAEDVRAADAIAAALRASAVTAVVNYSRRFAPAYRAVARELAAGELGRVQLVRGLYTKGVRNNGGHMLDLLRWFFGEPIGATPTAAFEELPGDPTVSFRLTFPDFAAEVAGLEHAACSMFELDIVGTRGRLVFRDLGHRLDRWSVDDATARHGFRQWASAPVGEDTGLGGAIAAGLDHLANCVEGTASPWCSVEDAGAALALAIDLAHAAAPLVGPKTEKRRES